MRAQLDNPMEIGTWKLLQINLKPHTLCIKRTSDVLIVIFCRLDLSSLIRYVSYKRPSIVHCISVLHYAVFVQTYNLKKKCAFITSLNVKFVPPIFISWPAGMECHWFNTYYNLPQLTTHTATPRAEFWQLCVLAWTDDDMNQS